MSEHDAQRVQEDRQDADTSSSFFRLGPLRFDSRISLASAGAFIMAFTAMVGGWYKFDYRISSMEKESTAIQQTIAQHDANDQRLADTISRENQILGGIEQALEDHNIHVRGDGYIPYGAAAADAPAARKPEDR